MKKLIVVALVIFGATNSFGQTRTTGSTGSTGSFGSMGGTGSTGSSALGQAAGSGAASSMQTQFGQAFNFTPGFSATGIASPFGTTTSMGRTGMGGMGMMGMGGMGMMGMGGMGMGGMGMNRNQQNMRGGTTSQQYTIRPTIKLGFESPLPSAPQRTQQVQLTMSKLPQADRFAGAQVSVDGRKAIVTGVVEKGQEGILKQLLLLEPGIYEVEFSQAGGASANLGSSRNTAEPVVPAPVRN